MYVGDDILNSDPPEETIMERWTDAQNRAKIEIYRLNKVYPGRWFTKHELDRVVNATLDSLVRRGLLESKHSEVHYDVVYYRGVGKWLKDMLVDEMK